MPLDPANTPAALLSSCNRDPRCTPVRWGLKCPRICFWSFPKPKSEEFTTGPPWLTPRSGLQNEHLLSLGAKLSSPDAERTEVPFQPIQPERASWVKTEEEDCEEVWKSVGRDRLTFSEHLLCASPGAKTCIDILFSLPRAG